MAFFSSKPLQTQLYFLMISIMKANFNINQWLVMVVGLRWCFTIEEFALEKGSLFLENTEKR